METPKVYGAIAAVVADMGAAGISKSRKNQQQGYNFRGIDDIYQALNGSLSKHGLCILPRVVGREYVERQTKSGGALYYALLDIELDFVAVADGSKHTISVVGEAMDSADKATNKAMSAAYKYACLMAFCIPVEGSDDVDAESHEPAPTKRQEPTKAPQAARPSTDAPKAPQGPAAHHESWAKARPGFCADLARLGPEYTYDNVGAFCVAAGVPRPSARDDEGRSKLLAYLLTPAGSKRFAEFVHTGTLTHTQGK